MEKDLFRVGDSVKVIDEECFTYNNHGVVVMVLDKEFEGETYTVVYAVIGNRWLPYEPDQLKVEFRPAYVPEDCLNVLKHVQEDKGLRE